MATHRNRRRRQMSEINVVPYIDVMLVLLVIFMVTAPLMVAGVKVELPRVDAPGLTAKRINNEPFVIVVDQEGLIFLNENEEPLANLNEIRIAVQAVLRNSPETEFRIRADSNAEYGFVVQAIDQMMDGGAENVAFITDSSKY